MSDVSVSTDLRRGLFHSNPSDEGGDMHPFTDSGWWTVMVIGMILFWAAVLAVIVLLMRNLMPRRTFSQPGGRP